MRNKLYRLMMSLSCTLLIATVYLQVTDTHALSASYTIKLCERTAW